MEIEPVEEPILSAEAIEYYWDHCYDCVMDNIIVPAQAVMPGLSPTWQQKDGMDAISTDQRVSVESGHGTGKSGFFSWVTIWWLITRMNPLGRMVKVPIFAPTGHQLRDILWPEFKRWIPISRVAPLLDYNDRQVFVRSVPGHDYKDQIFARALSPKDTDSAQGFHAEHLLVLADEAFGIQNDPLWETIEGYMTTNDAERECKMLIGGQHTVITGYVHDTFHKDRDSWTNLRFNSEESPIADPAFAERIARRYGKNSDVYRVRVLGTEPAGNPQAFILFSDADRARARWEPYEKVRPDGPIEVGVDPARFGDDSTVVTGRVGNWVAPQETMERSDTDQIVTATLNMVRMLRKLTKRRDVIKIKIDATGGYGAGAIDALSKHSDPDDNIQVVAVNFQGEGSDDYHDAVSVMWGEFRDDHLSTVMLPFDDDDLVSELATRRIMPELDKQGRMQIEPKVRFKDEYGYSPDKTDSLMLAFTQSAEVKVVINSYISTKADHRRRFNINWDNLGELDYQVYISLVNEEDTGIYGGFYCWYRKQRRLLVYNELYMPSPIVPKVVATMRQKAQISLKKDFGPSVTKIYAGPEFFGKGMNLAMQFAREKIVLTKNPTYEERAAIILTKKLFDDGSITLHYDNAPITDRDLRNWRVENGKPVPGFPMARSLLGMVSELRAAEELQGAPRLPPYSKAKVDLRDKLKKGYERKTI